ncbi:MAG: AAA family ATPase [Firmicutes bacterium]|nr:AAA family ATPase [Bacillota bacterium]MDD4264245.1 AAA family ATPase [Bacillota bacterium]MDD4694194.1 AAA family ATPase [Bacillota bacterium]
MTKKITDDLDVLLGVLPKRVRDALDIPDQDQLLEVVLDLGRVPEARFPDRFVYLGEDLVTRDELSEVISRIGEFGSDNRAGIERTLHRISSLRNRRGEIIGLTCRVGRAVMGTIDIISDIIKKGQSILLLGKPGVGKTTMLREIARELAEKKRVVVVDTSNEIGGDGDIPHPGIGRARRLQVLRHDLQYQVMIEAVENHMPEVIVIDEIGNSYEADAARTIAERGVMLIGTAHGINLKNLVSNPTLVDLVGGVQNVTLSDEEARRRGTQKSIQERKQEPTFQIVVEIVDRDELIVIEDVGFAIDNLLQEKTYAQEIRRRTQAGIITEIEQEKPLTKRSCREIKNIFAYGISRNKIAMAIQELKAPLNVVRNLRDADIVLTLKGQYNKLPPEIKEAEGRGLPIKVIRSNTSTQILKAISDIAPRDKNKEIIDKMVENGRKVLSKHNR